MKASQLIKELQEAIEIVGDKEVNFGVYPIKHVFLDVDLEHGINLAYLDLFKWTKDTNDLGNIILRINS